MSKHPTEVTVKIIHPCYRDDIEELVSCGCSQGDCSCKNTDTLYIKSNCHPTSPVDAILKAGTGLVVFVCRECSNPVVAIAIATRPKPENN